MPILVCSGLLRKILLSASHDVVIGLENVLQSGTTISFHPILMFLFFMVRSSDLAMLAVFVLIASAVVGGAVCRVSRPAICSQALQLCLMRTRSGSPNRQPTVEFHRVGTETLDNSVVEDDTVQFKIKYSD
jgi:hypothetical protein